MEAAQSSSQPATAWPADDQSSSGAGESGALDERPEILVGAAFAGGLALAGLLRWLDR